MSVVADEMKPGRGNVHQEPGQELSGVERLSVGPVGPLVPVSSDRSIEVEPFEKRSPKPMSVPTASLLVAADTPRSLVWKCGYSVFPMWANWAGKSLCLLTRHARSLQNCNRLARSVGAAIGMGFVAVPELTADRIAEASFEIEVAKERFSAQASLRGKT